MVKKYSRDRRPGNVVNGAYGAMMTDISAFTGRMKSPLSGTLLWLGVRRVQHLPAGGGQLRQRHPMGRLRRHFRRLRMDNGILEPVGQIGGVAAFVPPLRRVALGLRGSGGG